MDLRKSRILRFLMLYTPEKIQDFAFCDALYPNVFFLSGAYRADLLNTKTTLKLQRKYGMFYSNICNFVTDPNGFIKDLSMYEICGRRLYIA